MNIHIKRRLVFALCSAFILCASSCGNNNSSDNKKASGNESTVLVTTADPQISSDVSLTEFTKESAADTSAELTSSEEEQSQAVAADSDTVIIDDKVFITMMSDIYANTDNYMGKTITLTGMFDIYKDNESGKTYYSVYRNDSAGCCSYGIEVDWDENLDYPSPKQDQNVTATGVLDKYEENGSQYVVLHLSALTISAD